MEYSSSIHCFEHEQSPTRLPYGSLVSFYCIPELYGKVSSEVSLGHDEQTRSVAMRVGGAVVEQRTPQNRVKAYTTCSGSSSRRGKERSTER